MVPKLDIFGRPAKKQRMNPLPIPQPMRFTPGFLPPLPNMQFAALPMSLSPPLDMGQIGPIPPMCDPPFMQVDSSQYGEKRPYPGSKSGGASKRPKPNN